MINNGLIKLIEECGELSQIAAKKLAFPETDIHPDGSGSMKSRMEEEVADVLAAIYFVKDRHKLDAVKIDERVKRKINLFVKWEVS